MFLDRYILFASLRASLLGVGGPRQSQRLLPSDLFFFCFETTTTTSCSFYEICLSSLSSLDYP